MKIYQCPECNEAATAKLWNYATGQFYGNQEINPIDVVKHDTAYDPYAHVFICPNLECCVESDAVDITCIEVEEAPHVTDDQTSTS